MSMTETTPSKSSKELHEEWAALCKKRDKVMDRFFAVHRQNVSTYPSDEFWESMISVKNEYDTIMGKMDDYRRSLH